MTRKTASASSATEESFSAVVRLIEDARRRTYQAVNTELVGLYWRIGEYISAKLAAAEWGEGVIAELARHLARTVPGVRGFSTQNLWRMRQFFEAYRDDAKLSPLVREIPWTHNLVILGQSRHADEREFYLRASVREHWSKRELERQFRVGAFERAALDKPRLSPSVSDLHGPVALDAFKDSYAVEFLDLPDAHSEQDLHRGLIAKLKDFLIELGRDSVSSVPSFRCRSASETSPWTCCSSTVD